MEIDWQMNRAGLPLYSLSTVARSCLIEDEISRGTQRLYFELGTPHPIRFSFLEGRAVELTVKRTSAFTLGSGAPALEALSADSGLAPAPPERSRLAPLVNRSAELV